MIPVNKLNVRNIWMWLALVTFLGTIMLLLSPNAYSQVLPACTAARFPDYKNLGCLKPPCPPCSTNNGTTGGMPRWWVSEPYQNLWVADEPLSYPMSHGERMSFRMTHRQRYSLPPASSYYLNSGGAFFAPGRDTAIYSDMRTFGATNAAWCQSWLSDIVFWDYGWETNKARIPTWNTPQFNQGYEAFWFRADGGVPYFNSPGGLEEKRMRVQLQPSSALGYPTAATPVAGADGLYWGGDQTNGFRITFGDGSKEIYGFAFNLYAANATNSTARAFLTQRIDPQGRVTRIGYERATGSGWIVYRPRYVVDPDGRTNTIRYKANERWQVSEIEDPYGRKMQMVYSGGPGPSSITDAQNIGNSFVYRPPTAVGEYHPVLPPGTPYWTTNYVYDGWLSSYTTPYGPTSFEYYDQLEPGYTEEFYQKRAVRVTAADGSKQLFLYDHKTQIAGTPSSVSPVPSVAGWKFDDGALGGNHWELYHRNSFHWNARQYNALIGVAGSYATLSQLLGAIPNNAPAYRLAHMSHWLLGNDGISVVENVSLERDPSRDSSGSTEGAWTWYAYGNSSAPEMEPTEPLLGCTARVLPDGTTQFQCTDAYNAFGRPTQQRESYTKPDGSVGERTAWFAYPFSSPDLTSISNSFGQSLKLTYNATHQVTFTTNVLGEVTKVDYLTGNNPKLSGLSLIGGQTATLTYYSSNSATADGGFLKSVQWSQGPTWSFGYNRGLPNAATNDMGLWVKFTWDDLLRPTSVAFPDGTYTSNRYDNLDLVASRDRMGYWTYFGYDPMQRLTTATNANNAVTRLTWCGCGALESITDALTNITSLSYDNQGAVTGVSLPGGRSLTYFRDSVGRLTNVVDGLNRSFKMGWNNQGLMTSVSNAFGRVSRTVYDGMDRVFETTDANGLTITNRYDLVNRLTNQIWMDGIGESFLWSTNGLRAYTNRLGLETWYLRDPAGRLLAVTNANKEVTRAFYNSLSQITNLYDGLNHQTTFGYNAYGLQTNKVDALNQTAFRFGYDANGRLTSRWTPEKGTTAYSYDAVGNLTAVNYPVSLDITLQYDALNRLTNMLDAVGTSKFTYTAGSQLATEDGPWANDTVTYGYTEGLRTAMSLNSLNVSYGYDAARRMSTVTSGAGTFTYGYVGASPLIQTLTMGSAGTIANTFDTLERLTGTKLMNPAALTLNSFAYGFNNESWRTAQTNFYGNRWSYGHDNIGQLSSALGYEPNGTARLHEKLGYGYDAAGNLSARTNNAFRQTFTPNPINELTNVLRNGTFTAAGVTAGPATNVTVNSVAAARYGDRSYAAEGLSLVDSFNVFLSVAQNAAGLSSANNTSADLPGTISPTYDANGNMRTEGNSSFTWRTYDYDDENQLIRITTTYDTKSEFDYDGFGRKRIAREYKWQGGSWVPNSETHYVYDGMLAIQERDGSNTPLISYTRGLDLSGSLQGAGGIGGLLARNDHATTIPAYAVSYYQADGAGNIATLVNPSGVILARYNYDPYGNVLAQEGPLASANSYRFSSKEIHAVSGLYDYGYRFYHPNLQRWLNADPIGENGGINLYEFVFNSSLNWVDTDGRAGWRMEDGHGGWHFQLGDQRWDAQTLQPITHGGETPPVLKPEQFEELRKAGLLDKAKKMFPNGAVARAVEEAGAAGKLLKLSGALAKPLCKTLGRLAGPMMVVGAVSDVKAITTTAVTGTEAAKAIGDNAQNAMEAQKKVNERLNNGDNLSDDEITNYMERRAGGIHF